MGCGRPILIAADYSPQTLSGTVVVGWKETPQCARALGAAYPPLGGGGLRPPAPSREAIRGRHAVAPQTCRDARIDDALIGMATPSRGYPNHRERGGLTRD
jgi:hypothetical protein